MQPEPRETATQSGPAPLPVRALVVLASSAFASSINLRLADPLLPVIARDFGTTVGRAAAIVSAFTIGYGLLQLLFGPVGDRYGKYRVTALTALATGAATAFAATATSLEGLVLTRFIAGALAAAAIPLAFAWIGDVVAYDRRQAVLARFLTAQISGIVLGQAVGGLLADLLGWRSVLLLAGAIHGLAGLAMLAEMRRDPSTRPRAIATGPDAEGTLARMLGLLARPWIRVMLASVAIEGFAFYGAFAYIGADLHHRLGASLATVGLLIGAFGIGALMYVMAAPRLLGALGERGLALAGGMTLAIAYGALAATTTLAAVPPVMILLGLGFYMIHNTMQANATQMAPEARGLGVSLFAFALFVGQSVGVMLAAPIVDRWGAPAIYVAAAVILPAIALWFRRQLKSKPAI